MIVLSKLIFAKTGLSESKLRYNKLYISMLKPEISAIFFLI